MSIVAWTPSLVLRFVESSAGDDLLSVNAGLARPLPVAASLAATTLIALYGNISLPDNIRLDVNDPPPAQSSYETGSLKTT